MRRLILTLLMAVGVCKALYWQKLTCPFEVNHVGLRRVWCRQTSANCCTGFTFSNRTHSVVKGKLKVMQDLDSFTVALLEPSHGEGMYWCGVLVKNGTIIKLAESYFYSTPGLYTWSLTRWILLPLLPLVTIIINIYSRVISKHILMKKAESYDDVGVIRPPADPQDQESPYELE
ncbi:uncharacterized protein si:ch211-102c2.4 [Xyrichtys novacula]|uniref:Uncharacterized protein si:ch211-102c2.4 n=1 Tax=Xyrichtys novacula TaxID=13765 RepID=A0AAV1G6G0_XYRNO|nr:uncharacterized protein si:ch211-102c2.4 [Xyrichtys novacula]